MSIASGTRNSGTPSNGAALLLVVPRELEASLLLPLRRHWNGDPAFEVVVDRRRDNGTHAGNVRDQRLGRVVDETPALPAFAAPYEQRLEFFARPGAIDASREIAEVAQLVKRFKAGEREQSFAGIYERYRQPIKRHLTSMLGDPHAAEDAMHEVFERAYVALPRLELGSGKPLWAWLYTIARNYALNELQRHSHRRLESWDPVLLDREREATAGFAEDPASRWQRIADLRELELLLDDLPPDQCQAVVLMEVVGLDSREAAKVIGATPANVRQMKRRALEALHKSLMSDGGGLTSTSSQRMSILMPVRGLPVLARRRFALGNAGPLAAFGRGSPWR